MKTLFLEIYLFILCVNAGIMVVGSLSDDTLVTPFPNALNSMASQNVTVTAMPNIYNSTNPAGSLTESLTSNVTNGTSTTVLDPIQDNFWFILNLPNIFINFLTGGFIWNVLAMVGLPSIFVIAMQTVIGLLLVVTVLYYLTGR